MQCCRALGEKSGFQLRVAGALGHQAGSCMPIRLQGVVERLSALKGKPDVQAGELLAVLFTVGWAGRALQVPELESFKDRIVELEAKLHDQPPEARHHARRAGEFANIAGAKLGRRAMLLDRLDQELKKPEMKARGYSGVACSRGLHKFGGGASLLATPRRRGHQVAPLLSVLLRASAPVAGPVAQEVW